MKKAVIVGLFLILIMVLAAPAGATPPEDLNITLWSHYKFWDFYNPTGTWESDGLINSDGNLEELQLHEGNANPHGKPFQTAKSIEVIGDEYGTITIRSQLHGFEFNYDDDYCNDPIDDGPYDECFVGTGRWVILSGTEDYANLHGKGAVAVTGKVDWDAGIMDITAEYKGDKAHFDPTE